MGRAGDEDTVGDSKASGSAAYSTKSGRHSGTTLTDAVVRFPTPTARDWKSGKASAATHARNARPLSEVIGGQLNPMWVEWLMGYPLGWTDFEPSETRSCPPQSN